jgi:hypothetical protein
MSARAPWERDVAFMSVAAVAWPDDFAEATRPSKHDYGKTANQRNAARSRLNLRWQGYRHVEQVEVKLTTMKRAVDAMLDKVLKMVAATKG